MYNLICIRNFIKNHQKILEKNLCPEHQKLQKLHNLSPEHEKLKNLSQIVVNLKIRHNTYTGSCFSELFDKFDQIIAASLVFVFEMLKFFSTATFDQGRIYTLQKWGKGANIFFDRNEKLFLAIKNVIIGK